MVTPNNANFTTNTGINPQYNGDSFYFYAGDGIAFNTHTQTLFVSQTVRTLSATGEYIDKWAVRQLTLDGQEISSFTSPELDTAIDITILPNGNVLVLSTNTGRALEYTPDGQRVEGGIDINQNLFILPDASTTGRAIVGLFYNEQTGTIFGSDFNNPSIVEYDTQGNVLSLLDLTDKVPPGIRFQAVTIDPLTGNFLVVEDQKNTDIPGENTLYEVTRTGEVVSTTNLSELTGFKDPEGLAIDPLTRSLYVVFDNDFEDGVTADNGPNRNRVVALKLGNGSDCPVEPPSDTGINPIYNGESFEALYGDGLVFNPHTGTLFVSSTLRTAADNEEGFVEEFTIRQFTTDGQEISSFTSPELKNALDISVLSNGNLLLLDTTGGRVAEFTVDGQRVEGGIDFNQNVLIPPTERALAGLFYNPESGTIFGSDFFHPRILEYDTQGNVISTLDLSNSLPSNPDIPTGIAGVTIDSLTGNFLAVTDDLPEVPGGGNTLYEITRTGEIVSSVNLLELTGYADAEGLSIDPLTRTLYVAFDNDDYNGFVQDQPNRNRVVALKLGDGSGCPVEPVDNCSGGAAPEVYFPCGTNYDSGVNYDPGFGDSTCGYEQPWASDNQYSCTFA